ncbi:MAG: glycine cleavage system aminomethyltransferase GcvT [Acidimicrobiaceae bacterium]|nr:glycine cleavage system aminomethyltransferase GcvT [Acidimicrobiaceae bacterium]
MSDDLRQSPLRRAHEQAGARLVPFGGWEMPLQYPGGTVAEHMACRTGAAVFDVSHLGTVRVRGAGAHRALQRAFTNDLDRVGVGSAQYTHLLDPVDASVLDDIIVWWLGADVFEVMPNASNTDRVVAALRDGADEPDAVPAPPAGGGGAGGGLEIADVTADRAVIAVQGPEARDRVAAAGGESAASVGRFKVAEARFGEIPVTVAGTGYTGEDGVEMSVGVKDAETVWRRLLEAEVVPAGLGARDTLRLEAGLPLHGHELGAGITPLQAGLGWVVRWDKGDFRGRAALAAEREAGPHRRLRGLLAAKGRPPRDGCTVRRGGEPVGVVTSGNFSPVLGQGIALALLSPEVAVGDEAVIDVRGRDLPAKVVKTPFHR